MTRIPDPLTGDVIAMGDLLHLDTVCAVIDTLPPDRAVACMAYALRYRSRLLTYEPFGALVIKHARLINRMGDKS